MLNKSIVHGRLVAAPELKQTPNNTSVTRFRIAIPRNYKNSNGEYDSDFVSIIAWRGTAELVAKHFGKGDMIIVEGSLRSGSYEDKDGKKVYTTEIEANSVYFAGSKPKANASSDNNGYYPDDVPPPPPPPQSSFEQADPDDDYPF